MNKKGFTLMEIIVSVALLSIVMLLLFQLMIDLEYEDSHSSFAKDNQIKRATIIKRVEKDCMDNGLSLVTLNNSGEFATLNFKFANNTDSNVVVYEDKISYGGETWLLESDGAKYDFNNIKIITNPNDNNKLCSFILNVDSDGDGVCNFNCGTDENSITNKNEKYLSCPNYKYTKVIIPVITEEEDNSLDDIEFFYIGK